MMQQLCIFIVLPVFNLCVAFSNILPAVGVWLAKQWRHKKVFSALEVKLYDWWGELKETKVLQTKMGDNTLHLSMAFQVCAFCEWQLQQTGPVSIT